MSKIAIFSTSSRAIEVIENLHKNFEVSLVVTKSDKIIGRKKELVQNEVKKFAIKNNLKLIEIEKFDSEIKEQIKSEIRLLNVDLAISIDFGYILPESLIEIPKNKFVNVHFSLLPKYRGASAVQFAMLNDDKNYGITYHLIDKTLDTGDIIFQTIYPLNENLNSDQAYEFLFSKCAIEISDIISRYLKEELKPYPQKHLEASYTYSKSNPKYTFIFKEDAKIEENDTERVIFRKIKAYNPWPTLQASIKELLKIKQFNNYLIKPGFENVIVKINEATFSQNQLKIEEITIQNGKRLKVNDFINGFLVKN